MKKEELADEIQLNYIKKINIEGYSNIHFVISPPPPKSIPEKDIPIQLVSTALSILNSLPSPKEMSDLDKVINYLFVRREVVQSSRMEGTWSTIDHALTSGDVADANEGKDEHHAVRSYANLLEEMIQKTLKEKEKVFTKELIQEIQSRIVRNDPNSKGIPGKFRTPGQPGPIVTIGGGARPENSIYNPNPAETVNSGVDEIITWLQDEEFSQKGDAGIGPSLPIRLALAHSHFEAIHPFTDGNGRAGRVLWPMQMVCSGNMPLYLSGYVEENKDQYIKALESAQKKLIYKPLIEFICQAIIDSDIEMKQTKEAITKLEELWHERGKFNKGSAARRSLTLLLSTPIITAKLLQEKLNVSSTVAADTIKALQKKKIIRFRNIENRKRVYAAEELIQIISRSFGSEVELALEKAQILLEIKQEIT